MLMRYLLLILLMVCTSVSAADKRELVTMPAMMQDHMLANMRDHLATINQILHQLKLGQFDQAAELAEQKLGMSSLDDHGADHMARFMPPLMRETGTQMHRAASRFALKAQEADLPAALGGLTEITQACVNCHAAFRIR